jgi:hypothetical protein
MRVTQQPINRRRVIVIGVSNGSTPTDAIRSENRSVGRAVPIVNLIRLAIGGELDDPALDVRSLQADRRVDH